MGWTMEDKMDKEAYFGSMNGKNLHVVCLIWLMLSRHMVLTGKPDEAELSFKMCDRTGQYDNDLVHIYPFFSFFVIN